jgi:hypothetical protein
MDSFELSRTRSKLYWNHDGIMFPETMTIWGTWNNSEFGYIRTGKKPGDPIENPYLRYHFNSSLEFLAMLIECYEYTQDATFFKEKLLPTAELVLEWWDKHWPLDADGKLYLYPSHSVETYWECINDTPDLAGLKWDIKCLLKYPESKIPKELRNIWMELLDKVPNIPFGERKDKTVIFPAYPPLPKRTNVENPELYCVYPYRLYGLNKIDLELARDTFNARVQYNHKGWSQDELQAALLGLTDVVKSMIVKRAEMKHKESRFPAFWGPNFDWVPDQDHGANLMSAVQRMILQGDGDDIMLLPAFPNDWSVDFKLHLPKKTVAEGSAAKGKIQSLKISPIEREADIKKLN